MAAKIYPMAGNYDFAPYQMDADAALIKLGIAKLGIDEEYPEEGQTIIYPL
jgi:hypothetical protein